jgi:hypothetical protein
MLNEYNSNTGDILNKNKINFADRNDVIYNLRDAIESCNPSLVNSTMGGYGRHVANTASEERSSFPIAGSMTAAVRDEQDDIIYEAAFSGEHRQKSESGSEEEAPIVSLIKNHNVADDRIVECLGAIASYCKDFKESDVQSSTNLLMAANNRPDVKEWLLSKGCETPATSLGRSNANSGNYRGVCKTD